ncbi:hypothetical protein Clacol_001683 [Clathrus columnatus]|uniref:PIN domain-containing protein n=1 Tax=Clathrus columnatus TaxID=1419009 RepID=A0AAV5A384_9AGAM|nr:hypothetical protein Clacol_001683 [Clathrus columnatus]
MFNPILQNSYSYGTTNYELNTEFSNATKDNNVDEQAIVLLRYARDNWSTKFSYVNDSSAIIDTIDVEMQDITQDDFVEIYIVIDTNVLISYLSALKDLVSILHSSDRSRMPIVLLIPGIVVAELDYQKNCKREIAFESRKASEWLAKEISNGQGIVKGQAYSQTLLPSGDWRQRVGLSNDELILDCSKYFTRIKQKDVRLCTSDNNLVIQAAANANDLFSRDASAAILRPTLTWDCHQMLQQVIPGYIQPSMHALGRDPQKGTRRVLYHYDKMTGDNSVPRMDMDMDMDTIIESPSPLQRRDYLHQCIVSELQDHIRRIVEKATRLQEQRRKNESRYSRANSLFTGSLPTEEDWIQGWAIRDCLRYLIKILPPKLSRGEPFEEGDASSLADFLSLPGEKGARPGREWSKNDWGRELMKVSRLAQDYEYEGLDSNTLHNYEYRILTAFM